LPILPPDINRSRPEFTVEDGGIRFGLSAIKGVGLAAVEPILEAREREGGFESIAHCLRSLPPRAINHKVFECLAKAGCFDGFGVPRNGIIRHVDELMDMTSREREQRELGQGFLFDDLMSESLEKELQGSEPAEEGVRLGWERDVLGFYLSGHPLESYRDQLQLFADCRVAELPDRRRAGADRVTIGGLVSALKVMPIKKEGRNQGRRMAVWQLEDSTGSARVVAFPDDGRPVLVVAAIKGEGDHAELLADEVVALDRVAEKKAAALRIVMDLAEVDEELLDAVREYLLEHPGELPVRFELIRKGRFRARMVPPPALSVDSSQATRDGLKELVGSGWTEFEFDLSARNGSPDRRPLPEGDSGESAEVVN
jgi:DNA polymerase-3 subunit alpha